MSLFPHLKERALERFGVALTDLDILAMIGAIRTAEPVCTRRGGGRVYTLEAQGVTLYGVVRPGVLDIDRGEPVLVTFVTRGMWDWRPPKPRRQKDLKGRSMNYDRQAL